MLHRCLMCCAGAFGTRGKRRMESFRLTAVVFRMARTHRSTVRSRHKTKTLTYVASGHGTKNTTIYSCNGISLRATIAYVGTLSIRGVRYQQRQRSNGNEAVTGFGSRLHFLRTPSDVVSPVREWVTTFLAVTQSGVVSPLSGDENAFTHIGKSPESQFPSAVSPHQPTIGYCLR